MSVSAATSDASRDHAAIRPSGVGRLARRYLRRHTAGVVGGMLCLLIALLTILAPWIRPYDPLASDTAHLLQAPTLAHPFGTDSFGRDLLSRVLLGGSPTLCASVSAVILATVAGLLIGTVAGYARGMADMVLMRLMDVLLSFPFILLALVLVAGLGAGLPSLIIAIAVTQVPVFARLCRAVALAVAATEYVDAARAIGVGSRRLLWRHMLPNMIGPVIVQAATTLGLAIGLVAAFNFLGLGVQPPTPDWGDMVSDGRTYIFSAPYLAFFPGMAITITVVALSFLADGLRDVLDPTMR
jgi:peptide/nickel transport system permease protein